MGSRLEAFATSKTKLDSVDARLLARILATDLVPKVYPTPLEQQALIEGHLKLIGQLTDQVKALDGRIREEAAQRSSAQVLQTVPGIGPYRSLVLVAEIHPIDRFPSPAHLVSFAGLAPSLSDSGVLEIRYGSVPKGPIAGSGACWLSADRLSELSEENRTPTYCENREADCTLTIL